MAKGAKVAFFIPVLGGGGAERAMVRLANGLSDRVNMSFVLGSTAGPHVSELSPAVEVVDLKTPRAILAITSLARYIRDARPDAIMSTLDYANVVLLAASRLARSRSTRVVVRQANAISEFYRSAQGIELRAMPSLMRLTYPWADRVVAVSNEAREELVRLMGVPPERVVTIPNSVDIAVLAQKAATPVEHPWLASNGLPLVLGLGNLRREKDFANLVRAFALASDVLPSRLMLLGEGPERANIECLVSELGLTERVSLPGFVPNPYPYIARSAALVLSSVSEGMPNSLLEAMALGVNIVSTDCGSGPREIIQNGAYGRLVPVGNPEAMAEAIVATIREPLSTETLRDSALRFDPARALVQYTDVLLGD